MGCRLGTSPRDRPDQTYRGSQISAPKSRHLQGEMGTLSPTPERGVLLGTDVQYRRQALFFPFLLFAGLLLLPSHINCSVNLKAYLPSHFATKKGK